MEELADIPRLNLLIETLTDFASVPDLDRLILSLGARARFLVSFNRCVILLGDNIAAPSRVALVQERGVPANITLSDLSPLEMTLATRASDSRLPAVDDLRRTRVACYPIASLGKPLGVLIFTADRAPYSMSDLRTVQALTDACASVVARIDMSAALQSMADERGVALASERQAHAEAAAANHAKDEFLATLSHEMRTPLNAILGWVQTLQKPGASGERITRGLAAIERSANDQRRLIEDLLDMSRVVSGKFRLEIAAADLRTIIDDALTAIGPAADAKRLVIETDIDDDTVIRADPQRLQQVLWNLLSNSVKFTPPGGVITVTTARTHDSISIQVRDSGTGISPELLPYVFDRFHQGDGSPSRSHGGLGLGLSIVRNIVELHGGTVVAESPGRDHGTTMTMTLRTPSDPSR